MSDPYRIEWSASAARSMHRLPGKVIAAVAAFAEGALAESPYRVTKALRAPFLGLRSAQRGSYRVLVEIDEGMRVVRVFDVSHRADAYRPR